MLYTTALFDLDGTLIESGPGIFAATRAVLADMGLEDIDDARIRKMVGPPLRDSLRDVVGVPEELIEEVAARYRKKAETVGLDLIKPYPGVLDMLHSLREAGVLVGVVTSKITATARAHLKLYGLIDEIDYVRGGIDGPGHGADKLPLLLAALKDLDADPKRVVMVGDRRFDLAAARGAGIASIGVLYGYGDREELMAYGPAHLAQSVEALKNILLGDETGKGLG